MGSDKVEEPKELTDLYEIVPQGESAERIAEIWGLNRNEMDEYSLRSHQLADQATKNGDFQMRSYLSK